MNSIENEIMEIIKDKAGIQGKEISLDAHFANDLGLDSRDAVELILDLEKAFEVVIPDDEAQEIQTVRQAIEAITEKLKT
ncbi:MAG: acyl carrier protein [Bacteroidetes bacterium]|nr:acyl carrier protein [Bacteroidota bacterium]